jgi:hypothetical protein
MDSKTQNQIDTTVAQTILQQLGGAKFLLMTGSAVAEMKSFHVNLDLQKNKSKANKLKISYVVSKDSYCVQFISIKAKGNKIEVELVERFEDVYFDQLQDIFEDVTGLFTTLFPRD